MTELVELGRLERLRAEFPEPPASAGFLARCVAATARFASGDEGDVYARTLQAMDGQREVSGCRAALRARLGEPASPARALADISETTTGELESNATLWVARAQLLHAARRGGEAVAVLRAAIGRAAHAVNSLLLQKELARHLYRMGDSVAANGQRMALQVAAARDGRPWLRWSALDYAAAVALEHRDMPRHYAVLREQARIARDAGALVAEYWNQRSLGRALRTIANDPRAAIAPLTRSIDLADSIGMPSLTTIAYLERGNAYVAVGDNRRAEPDMRRALSSAPPAAFYDLAEAHHALAHLFESQSRWAEASQEADRYAEFARRRAAQHPVYMMSLHDGGMIKWKAGWHAAAAESFAGMVREVEAYKANYFYAGEYFERSGDFSRALGYYRRGAAEDTDTDRLLNLAGLVRMFDALGMRDSARAAATRHDLPQNRQGAPMQLPAMLLADGRAAEAIALARRDIAEQEARAGIRAGVQAGLQFARLLLDAGRASDAAGEALSVERRAAAAAMTDEAIGAILVRGRAQLLSRSRESIATLLRARTLVRTHPTAPAALAMEAALGEAYAAFGQSEDALIAYERAATTSQRVTERYEDALDRVRNREQRVEVFDGALRVLLSMPESRRRLERIFDWSARKKGVVLNHVDSSSSSPRRAATLPEVERRLGVGTALLDYIAVDSGICVAVVTASGARVVRLPMSIAAASDLVTRLRKPLAAISSGQLDLARAPFDLEVAHRLYAGLFAPLEDLLAGAQRIVVVPDGPLYGVPFNALPRAPPARQSGQVSYHAADYLIDRFTISMASSPGFVDAGGAGGIAPSARVLVVGGAVAGGEREVASIVSAWSAARTASLQGAAATESALREGAGGRSIVHFAVHARADENDPLAARLELARDARDDGYLHVAEIGALKFRGDLVVLTGCETLPGRVFAGTGPFGIASSFIAAGARNVIATHWPVGESAADLSGEFYRVLAGGSHVSDALRSAQLKLRRDPKRAHPFYWGGYVMVAGAGR